MRPAFTRSFVRAFARFFRRAFAPVPLAAFFLCGFAPRSFAADFGLLLDQTVSLDATGSIPTPDGFGYGGSATPWVQGPLGPAWFYVSAAFNAKYEYEEWSAAPELLRTELALAFSNGMELKAGRVPWADPLGYIAAGLFDGVELTANAGEGEFHAAAFYTGFLYKKAANITMTDGEFGDYYEPLDYGDFAGTYFAPRRLLASAGWEHPAIAELLRLKLALIVQYDLRPVDVRLHTNYLAARGVLPLGRLFTLSAGAVTEMAGVQTGGRTRYGFGFAGDLGLAFAPPTAIPDRLSLLGRFSSGTLGTSFTAFTPVTTEPQGRILKAKLSGLSMIQAAWLARLHRDLSLSAEAAYFIRSDLDAYNGRPSGDSGYLLGGEVFVEALWSPASDTQFRLGGGIFLPGLGNVAPGELPWWRVELGLLLAVY